MSRGQRVSQQDPEVPRPPSMGRTDRPSSASGRLLSDPRGLVGLTIVVAVIVLALAGPLVARFDPGDFAGVPYGGPSPSHPLGLDVLGRDVLSAVLSGGWLFLVESVLATVLGVATGTLIGVFLALAPRRPAELLLTINDTVLVLPQIIVALLVLTRLGSTPLTLILVVAIVHVPQTSRVVLVAAQKVVAEDYLVAARGFGASWGSLVLREILPNIAGVVTLEFGIRLAISAVVLASLAFLGFGSGEVEWGRMIHDNQGGLTFQPWAVMAPVIVLGTFLIGANLMRDSIARSLARKDR